MPPGGNNNSSGGGILTPTNPTPSGHTTPEDMKDDDSSTSPSIGLITGASVGVVALIFVILAVILVWRKRQQAQARIDHLFNDSLMASSGFQNDKPIYGRRSDPNDDHSATHLPAAMDGAAALGMSMNHEQQKYLHPRPPGSGGSGYSQNSNNNQPLPRLPHPTAQHAHYRQQQQQQQHPGPYHEYDQEYFHKEELPPQRQPSYRLPYSQPANDYNYPRRHQGMQ
ncbi:hypothetical protein EC968_001210 [Mortierella alpina]|nr:hypothetical protein EC968_001210 [Mortierella alpina]